MGFRWKPPSAQTIQAARPIKKLVAGQVKCRAQEGGNQKGLLEDRESSLAMKEPTHADKTVRERGRVTAMASDFRPRLAITFRFWRFSPIIPLSFAAVSGCGVSRCLRSLEAMEDE